MLTPATTTAITTGSKVLGNGCPQHVADRVADARDSGKRHERNERRQQGILEEILTVGAVETAICNSEYESHSVLSLAMKVERIGRSTFPPVAC